jgi:hypothetical protein
MPNDYTEPLAKLLNYKSFDTRRIGEPWPDYLKLGFTKDHVAELIRMTMDNALNNADQNSLEVWAPLHAWRTLGQLQALEAIKPLVQLFDREEHDAWLTEDLPKVFSLIGPASIPEIAEFLADNSVDEFSRISIPTCLEKMARDHPSHYEECVSVLVNQLGSYKSNGPTLNAYIVAGLTDLKATSAIGAIREAYSADCVDLVVQGDVEEVEIEMGLRLTRDTPPPDISLIPGLPPLDMHQNGHAQSPDNTVTNIYKNIGRNDQCPCGSGKKFKKCCLH